MPSVTLQVLPLLYGVLQTKIAKILTILWWEYDGGALFVTGSVIVINNCLKAGPGTGKGWSQRIPFYEAWYVLHYEPGLLYQVFFCRIMCVILALNHQNRMEAHKDIDRQGRVASTVFSQTVSLAYILFFLWFFLTSKGKIFVAFWRNSRHSGSGDKGWYNGIQIEYIFQRIFGYLRFKGWFF